MNDTEKLPYLIKQNERLEIWDEIKNEYKSYKRQVNSKSSKENIKHIAKKLLEYVGQIMRILYDESDKSMFTLDSKKYSNATYLRFEGNKAGIQDGDKLQENESVKLLIQNMMLLCLFRYELSLLIKTKTPLFIGGIGEQRWFKSIRDKSAYRTLNNKTIDDVSNFEKTPFWKSLDKTNDLQQLFVIIRKFVQNIQRSFDIQGLKDIYDNDSKLVVSLYKFQILINEKYIEQCQAKQKYSLKCDFNTEQNFIKNALSYEKYDKVIYDFVSAKGQRVLLPPPTHYANAALPNARPNAQPQYVQQANIQHQPQPQNSPQQITGKKYTKQHRLELMDSLYLIWELLNTKLFN
jgi:hypothetical protein